MGAIQASTGKLKITPSFEQRVPEQIEANGFEIVHITPEMHQSALALLQKRPDKNWSWVDAASFVVMRNRALTQALTTDHHFDQAGFERLIQ